MQLSSLLYGAESGLNCTNISRTTIGEKEVQTRKCGSCSALQLEATWHCASS